MAWYHRVSLGCLCMVHRIVLGRHWINCMSISGDNPILSFPIIFVTQMAEILNTHIHVHHSQAYKTTYPACQWYTMGMSWHGMARHEYAGENRKSSTRPVILSEWAIILWITFILELFQKKRYVHYSGDGKLFLCMSHNILPYFTKTFVMIKTKTNTHNKLSRYVCLGFL